MDTFELNKIAGALLGTVLLVMGLGIVAEGLYAPKMPAVPGYRVALPEEGGAAAEAEAAPEVSLASLLQSASAEKGAAQAKKCAACHTFEDGGPNKVGPNLHGIVGRAMAAHEGFGYSDAMKAKAAEDGTWTYQELYDFLANPKGFMPGTAMAFAGIKREDQRADLLLYLKEQSPDAPPLPVEEAAAAPAEAPAAAPAEAPAEAPAAAPAAETPAPAPAAPAASEAPASTTPMTAPAEGGSSTMAPADGGGATMAPADSQGSTMAPAESEGSTMAPSDTGGETTTPSN